MGVNSGFTGPSDLWWWCEDHRLAELNPPGLNGGLASEGHRWIGPYATEAECTSFNTTNRSRQ